MSKVTNNGPISFSSIFDMEAMKERRTKLYQDALKQIDDKIEFSNTEIEAVYKLQQSISALQIASSKFKAGILNSRSQAFSQKTTDAITNDVGNAGDYVTATIDSKNAAKGDIDVTVTALATTASVRTGLFVAGYNAMTANRAIQVDITNNGVGVAPITVNVLQNDTLQVVCNKLNAQLNAQNVEAILVKQASTNQQALVLRSTVTGLRTITVSNTADFGAEFGNGGAAGAGIAVVEAPGANASAVVDGVVITSSSNKLTGVLPGVDLNLRKINTLGQKQTISVIDDVKQAAEQIGDLLKAYNDYIKFSAIQQNWTGEDYAKDAVLGKANNRAIQTADNIIKNMVSIVPGLQGDITGLGSIGIGSQMIPADGNNTPAIPQLTVVDQERFTNAITNNLDGVDKLFRNNTVITPTANAGSTLIYLDSSRVLPANIMGEDIQIRVDVDGGGAVTAVRFSLDNGVNFVAAAYNNGFITFENTALAGMRLFFQNPANIAVNGTEEYTVNVVQGVCDKLSIGLNGLVNTTATGVVDRALQKANEDLKRYNVEKDKAQTALDDQQKKIAAEVFQLRMLEIEAEFFNDFLEGLLDNR
ncbi:Flagellar hook protein FliD [Candidatus Trichorickettsia mobilis]|uniref:Flagellar hook-associated protein 2 n=1 Tax=Candidatus Trichorickettsia mobilis TaxID=1346319 RepID=A0ABZ0UTX3_9RICK|nr:flagellar filament capping protein FliD [Candidatus Trichorickettsia mobilis]WPY00324.1 Flagellar hook protein FliD [Candidatus Trichorickettsia mobilis]